MKLITISAWLRTLKNKSNPSLQIETDIMRLWSPAFERRCSSKNILAASAFGWTGGDDEEYQAFHRRLASEEQDDQESEVYREINKEERDEEIDGDSDRAAFSVVDGVTVPI